VILRPVASSSELPTDFPPVIDSCVQQAVVIGFSEIFSTSANVVRNDTVPSLFCSTFDVFLMVKLAQLHGLTIISEWLFIKMKFLVVNFI